MTREGQSVTIRQRPRGSLIRRNGSARRYVDIKHISKPGVSTAAKAMCLHYNHTASAAGGGQRLSRFRDSRDVTAPIVALDCQWQRQCCNSIAWFPKVEDRVV